MTEVKAEQSAKAAPPIVFTLFGIMIEDKAEQLKKANSSIVVTLLPIVTEVILVQFWKACKLMVGVYVDGDNEVSIIPESEAVDKANYYPIQTLVRDGDSSTLEADGDAIDEVASHYFFVR